MKNGVNCGKPKFANWRTG